MNDTEDRSLQECLLTNDKMEVEDPTQQEERTDGQHLGFQPFEIEQSLENVPLISSEQRPDSSLPEQQERRLSSLLWSLLKQRTPAIGFHREVVTPLDPLDETTLLGESGMEESVGELMLPDVKDPHLKWPTSRTPYFFLSQTDRDNVKKDISRPTYWFLTTVLRIQAFLDEEGTLNGVDNVRALIEPAYKSTHALLILSPTFRRRRFCVLELNTFMGRDRRQPGEIKVLPALWLMNHLDHRYASGVRDMKWFVQADTRFSVDYMVRFLWPALVHELGLPKMTTEQLEGYICQYVQQHRDTDQHEISKDLVRFERRTSQKENRGDHHAYSTIPLRQRRQPSLWRVLNQWAIWAIGVFVVASVFVSMTMTADPGQLGVTHQERPKPVDKEGFPRSTLPSALPLLFGRDEDLRQLGAYLKNPGTMAALTGGAGVGKSHCANKFALDWVEEGNKLNKRRFGFWITAETEIEVRLGYNTILEALGVELQEADEYVSTKQLAGKVFLELTKNSDFEWIIVFDNVPAADTHTSKRGPDVIKDWFFSPPKYTWDTGRILFTTQSWSYQGRTALGETKRFHLQPLSLEDSMAMLLTCLGIPRQGLSRTNKKAAELLLGKDYFDGLPIAIEAAASYINENGMTLTEYLDRMKGVDAQSRVNKAMQLVTDFARTQGNMTRILDIIAFVSPSGIPLWLLGEDRETVDDVGHLTTLSIIKWDDHEQVSMHRLYQIALQKDGHIESAIAAVNHVLFGFDERNHQTWSRPKELIPHVQSLKDHFGGSPLDKNVTLAFSESLHISGLVMMVASFEYYEAKRYFEDSLEMKWAVYGQDAKNVDLTRTINNLGVLLKHSGDYKGAKERYEQALEMLWAVYGQDAKNTDLASAIHNLGVLLQDIGDYKGAKERFEQALAMKWAVYGQDAKNTDLAGTINNLGILLKDMGDNKGAKERYEQALEMKWAEYGPDAKNTDLASMINNLGTFLQDMGDYKGAKERYEQALEMQWAVYGQDTKNTDLAHTINNLGVLLLDMGDHKGSKERFEQALAMQWAVYGQDAKNADLAGTINNLGILLQETGDYKGAKERYKEALEMKWAVYGQDARNRDLARTIGNLSILLEDMGDYKGAKKGFEQALEMMWAVYGQDAKNTDLASAIHNLGWLLKDMGDYKGAKE